MSWMRVRCHTNQAIELASGSRRKASVRPSMTRWAPLDGFGKATAPSAADAGAPGCVGANVTRLVDTKGGRDPTGRRCGTASRLAWCSSVIQRYEPTREGATHSINRSPLTGGLHTDKGACDPAGEAAQIAMEHQLPLAVVCRLLDAPRSTIYARRRTGGESGRRGRCQRSATRSWSG
jgi:hypothetical protein